jgi:hypothetical protein
MLGLAGTIGGNRGITHLNKVEDFICDVWVCDDRFVVAGHQAGTAVFCGFFTQLSSCPGALCPMFLKSWVLTIISSHSLHRVQGTETCVSQLLSPGLRFPYAK